MEPCVSLIKPPHHGALKKKREKINKKRTKMHERRKGKERKGKERKGKGVQ
jgi:hypothetical protein